jgi:hypothetical protein
MTRQYLVGEFSAILGDLQDAGIDEVARGEVHRLRRQVEALPPTMLATPLIRAAELIERLCWRSLIRGDLQALMREMAVADELREFGACAGFRDGDLTWAMPRARHGSTRRSAARRPGTREGLVPGTTLAAPSRRADGPRGRRGPAAPGSSRPPI